MAATKDLWKQTTAKFKGLIQRYWLLASRPSIYFDKFIKDQNARELRRTAIHSVVALSAIPLSVSAVSDLFSYAYPHVEAIPGLPTWLTTTLTSKYLFLLFVILATIPAFLITLIIYLLVRAQISDLVFVCLNILTLYAVGVFAFFLLLYLIGAVIVLVSLIATGSLQFIQDPMYTPNYWAVFILMTLMISFLAIYFYVPTILVERSTRRSTLFASTLCILYVGITVSFMGFIYDKTVEPIKLARQPPGLQWCTREDGGRPDLTIASCTIAIETQKHFHLVMDAFINRGDAYFRQGEYERAIDDYSSAIKLYPENVGLLINRGAAYFNMGEYDRAIEDYTVAIKLDPKNARAALTSRGNAYFYKNEYNRAIDDYSEAITLDPLNVEAFRGRGITFDKKKDFEHARKDFTEAIKLDQTHAETFNSRGITHFESENYDGAIKDFSSAIKLNTESATYFKNRGSAYLKKKDWDGAIEDYNQAIRLEPTDAITFKYRGDAYSNKKNYDQAIKDYSEAIKLDPKYADAFYNRGIARKAQGENSRANADFDTAKRLRN